MHDVKIGYSGTLFTLLLILIVWLPLPLGSNRPWAWGVTQVFSFVLLSACLVVYRDQLVQRLRDFWLPITLLLLFTLWSFVQYQSLSFEFLANRIPTILGITLHTISFDPAQTEVSFYRSLSLSCLMVICLLLIDSLERAKYVMLTILCSGLFQALYGSLEILLGIKESFIFALPVSNVATGSFVYKNHYANFLMLTLSIGVGYLIASLHADNVSTKQRVRILLSSFFNGKVLIRLALAVMVIALVMSRSRMGNVAFFTALSVVSLLALFYIKNRSKGMTFLIISMLVIDLFIVSSWFGLEKVQQRITTTSFTQESRDEVINDTVPMIKAFGLLGTGAGSFYSTFPSYQRDSIGYFYDHAHNDYVQFIIESGLIGTSLLALLILLSIYHGVKALRTRQHPLMIGMAFGGLTAILGMLIHMSLDFPLQSPTNAAYLILIISLTLKSRHMTVSSQRRRSQAKSTHVFEQDINSVNNGLRAN